MDKILKYWGQINIGAILPRALLSSVVVTLMVWLGWSLLTPVSWRLAQAALMKWGFVVCLGMTLLLCAAWAICRAFHLALRLYPALAGGLALLTAIALHLLAPSGMLLPVYGVAISAVFAAKLSMLRSPKPTAG